MGAPVLLQMTTLELVRARLKMPDEDTSNDALIEELIDEISRGLEHHMKRHAAQTARTEIYRLRRGETMISLRGAPVTAVSSVTLSQTPDFTGLTAEVPNEGFYYDLEEGTLFFTSEPEPLELGVAGHQQLPVYVRVAYTGGMAVDTDSFVEIWPDLAGACARQVAHAFQRRNTPGGNVQVGMGQTAGQTQYIGKYDLLPDVVTAFDRHTRVVL